MSYQTPSSARSIPTIPLVNRAFEKAVSRLLITAALLTPLIHIPQNLPHPSTHKNPAHPHRHPPPRRLQEGAHPRCPKRPPGNPPHLAAAVERPHRRLLRLPQRRRSRRHPDRTRVHQHDGARRPVRRVEERRLPRRPLRPRGRGEGPAAGAHRRETRETQGRGRFLTPGRRTTRGRVQNGTPAGRGARTAGAHPSRRTCVSRGKDSARVRAGRCARQGGREDAETGGLCRDRALRRNRRLGREEVSDGGRIR